MSYLKKIIREFSPNILHVHLPNLSPLFIPFIRTKIPIVVHWHADVVGLDLLYNLYKLLERNMLRVANAIIVNSREYLHASRPLRDFNKKCTIVPLGIDPVRLKTVSPPSKKILGWIGKDKYILSVGRLTYYKGFEYLIEAFNFLDKIKLIIVGEGKQKKKLLRMVERMNLTSRVLLTGYLPEPQKAYLLKHCFGFCLPSYERTESFGISILEAMFFGKPIITTRIEGSGINIVNKDRITGVVVEPKSVSSIVDGIKMLMSSDEKVRFFGGNSRQHFYNHFHIKNVATEIIKLYEDTYTYTC